MASLEPAPAPTLPALAAVEPPSTGPDEWRPPGGRATDGHAAPPSLQDASLYINRELSWLQFNERVLEEGLDPQVPALERFKFLSITSSNLDEFFMIRVAGLKRQIDSKVEETGPDALSPAEQLARISGQAHDLVARQYKALNHEVLPLVQKAGLRLLKGDKLDAREEVAAAYFDREVFPVLTPIAIDPGHPFPHLRNKSLNLAVRFTASGQSRLRYGVVPVPAVLPRLVELSDERGRRSFVLLEDLIARFVERLFPGMPVDGCYAFRVTRNWDLSIDEEEGEDLLATIEREVRRRDHGGAVRLEIATDADRALGDFLQRELELVADDVYRIDGPLNIPDLLPLLARLEQKKELHDEPFTPVISPALGVEDGREFFRVLRERDVLLHHPYESFDPVVAFVEAAADDPDVLAIKQTLYRTGKDSPVVRALQRAAENRKQVTALVELKARMDEEANILWARALEQSGVHVVYGLLGYKTHCKVTLVVRKEEKGLRRYVHLGTGNYNPSTARIYTDLSLFTSAEGFGADATSVFNLLTGYSRPARWEKFRVAPMDLRQGVLDLIERETQLAAQKGRGRIAAKLNSIADPDVIRALYRASQAGVQIDLIVRGVCCLRPGVPGVSDRIRVTSIVDRFLEHHRIWFFEAGGKEEVWLASADWMSRNFGGRVEIAFPVEDPLVKDRVVNEILGNALADNVKARSLRADGSYVRVAPGTHGTGLQPLRSQERFMALARRSVQPLEPAPTSGIGQHEIFPSAGGHRRPERPRKTKQRL